AESRLEPLNAEAYHNRGAIYERQGKREAAIAEYRTALRYNPTYAPSRQALQRLGGGAPPGTPRTDAERLAAAMADRASQAARRGDYPGAVRMLDEAARLAPGHGLLYPYRSDRASLLGDPPGPVG